MHPAAANWVRADVLQSAIAAAILAGLLHPCAVAASPGEPSFGMPNNVAVFAPLHYRIKRQFSGPRTPALPSCNEIPEDLPPYLREMLRDLPADERNALLQKIYVAPPTNPDATPRQAVTPHPESVGRVAAANDSELIPAVKIAEQLANRARTSISEYYATSGTLPSNNAQAGIASPSRHVGPGIKRTAVTPGGEITITFDGSGDYPQLRGRTLIHTVTIDNDRRGRMVWDCSGGTLPANLRPQRCTE